MTTPKPKKKKKTARKVRRPKSYWFMDGTGVGFDFCVEDLPLHKLKKLHAWLTRAIAYLESQKCKAREDRVALETVKGIREVMKRGGK